MKIQTTLATLCALPLLVSSLQAAGGVTGSPFYGDAPDEHHPWAVHDHNRPQPTVVTPGTFSSQEVPGQKPSDAISLFSGEEADTAKWEADKNPGEATKWIVKDKTFQCVPGSGYVRTKEQFGDCQLHVEWTEPTDITGESQGRGNSGIFLMGMVEVQVLDSYNSPSYADGMAGAVYGVNPPMVNVLRPPGQWQSYDIIFRRPIFKDGKELDPGYLTVLINGVIVQDHTPIEGGGGHKARSHPKAYPETGPLKLQDHGNPVRYRNIWYRPLPPRAIEGGTNGYLTEEATTAKRKEIASDIRRDAAKLEGNAKTLALLESLVYEKEEATMKEAEVLVSKFIADAKALPADKIESKKGEILQFNTALQYLAKFNILAEDKELPQIVKANGWDKKK